MLTHTTKPVNRLPGPSLQTRLKVGKPGDKYEREADAMADRVMRMPAGEMTAQRQCAECQEELQMKPAESRVSNHIRMQPLEEEEEMLQAMIQRQPMEEEEELMMPKLQMQVEEEEEEPLQMKSKDGETNVTPALQNQLRSSKGKGSPLTQGTNHFMSNSFGADFSSVNIHTGNDAIQMNRQLGARAFTYGSDIYFNKGEYSPESSEGKHLLAHELTHVVQQNGNVGTKSKDSDILQRAPTVEVLDENFIGPPAQNQRRATKSCPVYCNGTTNIGTLHSMGLFYHQSRSGPARSTPSAGDNGVGTALHFIGSGSTTSCPYDDIKIIQVIKTTHPAAGRNGGGYVDNGGRNTPFYGDVYLSGSGEHVIPANYPDAGERISTTHSIYDRPYRSTTGRNTTIQWEAEANVVCVRNSGADRVLGGVSYGFRLPYNTSTSSYGTIQGIGPSCHRAPSGNFINTLRTDPTISGYNFTYEIGLGDFPTPDTSTMVA
jgi:hypothetical protein